MARSDRARAKRARRLTASVDITGFSPVDQVILPALQTYGMIVADNGSPWFIGGVPSASWNNTTLHQLTEITGSDFEVVDESCLMVSPDSGATDPTRSPSGGGRGSRPGPGPGRFVTFGDDSPVTTECDGKTTRREMTVPTIGRSRMARGTVLALAAAALVAVVGPPAGATAPAGATVGRLAAVPSTVAPVAAGPAAKATKSSAAGYGEDTTAVSSASVTVTLPSFTCTKKLEAIATAVVVLDETADQASEAVVVLACTKKKVPFYADELVVDGQLSEPPLTMVAGDAVNLSVSCGASGSTVSVDDTTADTSVETSSASASSCPYIVLGDLGLLKTASGKAIAPLPSFGSIPFSAATINGDALGSFTTVSGDYFEGKKNTIATGDLTDGGTAFVTTEGA